tara:strand:+ start:368 stop:1033 length:666 start_codon:yes stop_codon:yes gene_type:complete
MQHSTVLFDLDGTLIDQFTAIHKSVNHVRNELGLSPANYDTVKTAVGGSVSITLKRLFKDAELETTLPIFKEHFEKIMMEDVFVLPGILPFLDHLKQQSVQIGVLTNKIGSHARATLDYLGISSYFKCIAGVGDTDFRKPDYKFTEYILDQMEADQSNTCLIGDSPFDWETGIESDLVVYLVASGTHNVEKLKDDTESPYIYDDIFTLAREHFDVDLKVYE